MHQNPKNLTIKALEKLYEREIEKLKYKLMQGARQSEVAEQTERTCTLARALHELNTHRHILNKLR
jgi:hypothetical protein